MNKTALQNLLFWPLDETLKICVLSKNGSKLEPNLFDKAQCKVVETL